MSRFAPCLIAFVACATARPAPPSKLYPGVLTRPAAHPGDFLRRQKLTARFGEQTQSFEAVLQKQGDKLKLLGLTPFGTKAFLLEQDGLEVTFTSYLPRELPFPPRYILQDVHRVYFSSAPGEPPADGEHAREQQGEKITELWRGGRLLERRFTRVAADPPGVLAITYQGGMAGSTSPRLIAIDNGWLGYSLSIETLSEQTL